MNFLQSSDFQLFDIWQIIGKFTYIYIYIFLLGPKGSEAGGSGTGKEEEEKTKSNNVPTLYDKGKTFQHQSSRLPWVSIRTVSHGRFASQLVPVKKMMTTITMTKWRKKRTERNTNSDTNSSLWLSELLSCFHTSGVGSRATCNTWMQF